MRWTTLLPWLIVPLTGACETPTEIRPERIAIAEIEHQIMRAGEGTRAVDVVVRRLGGYSGIIQLWVDSVPPGFAATIQGEAVAEDRGGSGNFHARVEIDPGADVEPGRYFVILQARGEKVHPATRYLEITVNPPSVFRFTVSPWHFKVPRGGEATGEIRIYRGRGTRGAVTFSYRRFPGLAIEVTPNPVIGDSAKITIRASASAASAYIFGFTGTISGGDTRGYYMNVDVTGSVP